MIRHCAFFGLLLAAGTSVAQGAESGFGAYLIGSRGMHAGIVPAPGFHFATEAFFYSGTYTGPTALGPGEPVQSEVSVDLAFDLLTPIWVTPFEIAGGRLGMAATLPVGYVGVGLETSSLNEFDSLVTYGDPLFAAFVGWHRGNLHWNVGASYYAPIGAYDETRLAHLALHRPALDLFTSATWLDSRSGLTITGSGGFTINGENTLTEYRTGTEFHFEGGITKVVAGGFSVGVFGYHYNQISPDEGAGARLGGFEGRATALGAVLGYDFAVGSSTISARLQILDEFDVRNRFEGTPFYLSIFVSGAH